MIKSSHLSKVTEFSNHIKPRPSDPELPNKEHRLRAGGGDPRFST